jgi:hypothetical protein
MCDKLIKKEDIPAIVELSSLKYNATLGAIIEVIIPILSNNSNARRSE